MIKKWVLKWLGINNKVALKSVKDSCMLINDGRHLKLAMPDGTIIPRQAEMTIINNYDNRYIAKIQITVNIPLKDSTPNLDYYIQS